MRNGFVESVLNSLSRRDSGLKRAHLLAVCASFPERDLFAKLGFTEVTISNLDTRLKGDEFAPFRWSRQDAMQLQFADESFDYAFVSDGLHHCSSPHRALLELYRVSRKGIIVVESRDSALMRLSEKLGLAQSYEIDAVVDGAFVNGGVDNTGTPNYVYRWTEREFEKTIYSSNPTGRHDFHYFYGLSLPRPRSLLKRLAVQLLSLPARILTVIFRGQSNSFAMVVFKPNDNQLWPWIERGVDGSLQFRRAYVASA